MRLTFREVWMVFITARLLGCHYWHCDRGFGLCQIELVLFFCLWWCWHERAPSLGVSQSCHFIVILIKWPPGCLCMCTSQGLWISSPTSCSSCFQSLYLLTQFWISIKPRAPCYSSIVWHARGKEAEERVVSCTCILWIGIKGPLLLRQSPLKLSYQNQHGNLFLNLISTIVALALNLWRKLCNAIRKL